MNFSTQNKFEKNFFYSNKTYVHPSSVIGSNVKLKENVKIGPFCTIIGDVTIGENTRIYSNTAIGVPAEDIGTNKPLGEVIIGKNCSIREFVSIGASKRTDGKTIIGNNCYVMNYAHIAHDVTLEDNVILINNVNLGGHTHIEKNAFLMANSATHQFCRIGKFSALTPFSAINQDLPPFCMFHGIKAKYHGLNVVALKRGGLTRDNINSIQHVAKLFYQDKLLLKDIKALQEQNSHETWAQDKYANYFLNFIAKSARGVSKQSII